MRLKTWSLNTLCAIGMSILILVFSVSWASAQSVSDEEWIKDRLVRIHAKYTWAGDHDQFLHKLQQALLKTDSPIAHNALSQILVWREELRPTVVRGWVSSISTTVAVGKNDTKQPLDEVSDLSDRWVESNQNTWSQDQQDGWELLSFSLRDDRYELANGFIDVSRLQTTRLWWVNELRLERGRQALVLNSLLHKTASDRSETMKRKWVGDHRRFENSAYYAYGELEEWFAQRWVQFVNISRATFTENIGRSSFYCKQTDCTQIAIDAMRQSFDYYLREEGTKNDAHWRTMIHPLFEIVGLWITVDESAGKFYLTTHYGTQIK